MMKQEVELSFLHTLGFHQHCPSNIEPKEKCVPRENCILIPLGSSLPSGVDRLCKTYQKPNPTKGLFIYDLQPKNAFL
jgi:hypothetical protein